MIRSPAGFSGEIRNKRYTDYYQAGYGPASINPLDFTSPLSLFASGAQGVWYDPSDFSTLFQDSAGTTPVTAVEQSVGLMLDKSGKGNNASQSVSGSRPVISAKVNQVLNSRFSGGVSGSPGTAPTSWANISVGTPSFTYAADSEATGNSVRVVTDTTQRAILRQFVAVAANTVYCASMVVDTVSVSTLYQYITWSSPPAGATITFSLNGSVVAGATSVPAGRHTLAAIITVAATAGSPELRIGGGIQGAGIVYDITIRQVQVQSGSVRTNYQWTNTATDYDTSGFNYYLRFDGTDDSLATSSIDFSVTDAISVFAGARKMNNAAQGVLAELTSSAAVNDGAFLLAAPNSAAANYNFASKGTTLVDNIVTTFTAPITNVITGLGNISSPSNVTRVNGVQAGAVTTTQGTGSYANAALYIGQRGGTTLPFNGRLYSLIVVGKATTPAEIASTERWVNSKTGAY